MKIAQKKQCKNGLGFLLLLFCFRFVSATIRTLRRQTVMAFGNRMSRDDIDYNHMAECLCVCVWNSGRTS